MENMSILNLFNFQSGMELPKQVDSPASVPEGEFENVFKKYLDRSETPAETDTAQNQKEDVKAEEPETPEEVIENLDIPEDQKAELKVMLEVAETPEEIIEFLDELMSVMKEAGAEIEEVDQVLTDIAKSVLSSDEGQTEKETLLLEHTLDRVIAVRDMQKNTPQLTVVKNDVNTVKAETSSDKGESGSARKETLMNMVQQKNSEQLPADVKEKIIELASRQTGEKVNSNNDANTGFTLKTEVSEKVIKTEIRIESPRDIMKFAELVELAKSQKANKLNIQLHPQELGRVQIELTEQAGRVSGRVVFESETAKNLFTSNTDGLRQQLAEKGIIVESLEFLFKESEHHEFAGWEGREGKKNGSSKGVDHLADSEAEEEQDETDGVYA